MSEEDRIGRDADYPFLKETLDQTLPVINCAFTVDLSC